MTTKELERKLSTDGMFLSITELSAKLNTSRDSARELLKGLEYVEVGRSKRFFAGDVAKRIMERRKA